MSSAAGLHTCTLESATYVTIAQRRRSYQAPTWQRCSYHWQKSASRPRLPFTSLAMRCAQTDQADSRSGGAHPGGPTRRHWLRRPPNLPRRQECHHRRPDRAGRPADLAGAVAAPRAASAASASLEQPPAQQHRDDINGSPFEIALLARNADRHAMFSVIAGQYKSEQIHHNPHLATPY